MKFAILTDIHFGAKKIKTGLQQKITENIPQLLDNFSSKMNLATNPEFVVILGDLIQSIDEQTDKQNIKYILNKLSKLECPVYYIAGNNEQKNLPQEWLKGLFEYNELYYSFDTKIYHFIMLHSQLQNDKSGLIDDTQKEWLMNDLKNTNKNTIIFIHHSLSNQDVSTNPYFITDPQRAFVSNRQDIRKILKKSNKVQAVFSSHLHWNNKIEHDNIPYFTTQSLVENEEGKGIASEAYAIVDINDKMINVNIMGNYPKVLQHIP